MGALAIQPNSGRAYLLAAGLLAAALLLQWLLRPALDAHQPFLFVLPAVGIAAMWGGWKPAMLVVLGGLLHALLWLGPPGTAGLPGGIALAGYLLGALLLAGLGGRISQLHARAAQAGQHLGEQVRDLQALHELSARIALEPDLHAQLGAILRTLCELEGAPQGLVSLRDPASGTLQVAASVGFRTEALPALSGVAAGQDACGLAFQQGRPVVVEDTERDPCFAPYRELARREGFRCVHSRPLLHHEGHVNGVISLHFHRPCLPGARDDRLGELCARMASVLAERDAALRQANAMSHRLEVALDTSAVPFCLVRPEHGADGEIDGFRWEYLNAAAARLLGRPAGELSGLTVRDSLRGGTRLDPDMPAHALQALRAQQTLRFETWVESGGARSWFQVIASPYDAGLAVWFSDVTERRRQEEALRDADRRKDEFLATLAHELRNPLAPIRQAALIAKAPGASQAQKRWSHEVIDRQIAHMAVLLDDLLDVSRITRGKLELRRAVVPLAQVVEAALEAARPLVDARGQQLHVWLPPEPLWLDADPMRLAQVLSNLLANAAKYTQEGGRIALAARAEDGQAAIEVRDNGRGIAPEALESIFEMFTQVRGTDGATASGLGIGLALSRGLVALHGGTLAAASEGVGRGSCFTVRLPLAQPPALAAPAALPARAAAHPRRVLVADDNRDAAESLGQLLRMQGHEVTLAFDGAEALDAFRRVAPEVALLDIGMPRLSGNEVASAIRASPGGAAVMLVAITGWGQERDRAAAREAGFDFHFTKPVDPEKLLQLLETHDAAGAAG